MKKIQCSYNRGLYGDGGGWYSLIILSLTLYSLSSKHLGYLGQIFFS